MKSKIFRWYERHERAVNAVLEIACDTIPGAGVVKGVINLAHSTDQDNEEVQNDQRIQELENMLAVLKPQMSDLLEEIEDLRNFKEASTTEEIQKMIYENQHIVEELNEVLPIMSTSISKSISRFTTLTEASEEKYETLLRGKYILECCLATGGQGVVYRGRNTVADREVAIKLLPKEFTQNTHGVEVLKAEYRRLVDKLAHTNIVQYRDLDFSQEKQQWFITMDYIDGHTLRKSIFEQYRKPFTPEQVHKYLMPVAQALEYAHNNSVVHCDLKPENIMISRNGNVLLTDFGLSQEIQQSIMLSAKDMQKVCGTLPYMAPEQYKGWGVTKHTDVWSLGVIMYEMLAGRHPFQAITYEHYKDIICNEQPRPLDDQRIWYVIQQALHKNDRERVSSPVTLVKQLLDTEKVTIHSIADTQQVKFEPKENGEKKEQINEGYELCQKGIEYQKKGPEGYKKALEFLNKAAELGNSNAMCHLGHMYSSGLGVKTDNSEAVKWYRKAAELGNSDAMVNLGVMYENGHGVDRDDSEAVKWYRKSAEGGNSRGMFALGLMYDNGEGVEHNDDEAVKWYRKAAEGGDSSGMFNLGVMYENGRGVEQDDSEAIKWYRKAAELGDRDAMLNLGVMYDEGRGVKQNDTEAVKWYTNAAEGGDSDGMLNLGNMYVHGRGVEQDDGEAMKWFKKAAEGGNSSGMFNLGMMYENGHGVDRDDSEAVKWYRKAAEGGESKGMFNLGWMYKNGRGVEQNDSEAVKWYRKAAEKGSSRGMFILGVMYESGDGVEQDDSEAVKWYRKSAEEGDRDAMVNLGLMYESGNGVEQDNSEAMKWFRKSAEGG